MALASTMLNVSGDLLHQHGSPPPSNNSNPDVSEPSGKLAERVGYRPSVWSKHTAQVRIFVPPA